MSRKRLQLTRAEQIEYLERARWLRNAGAWVEVPESPSPKPSPLQVSQYGPRFNDIIFNRYPGQVVVVCGVRLLARRAGIVLCDCQLTLPWDGPQCFLWLTNDESKPYRLCRGVEFPREQVLNHIIDEGMTLKRGVPVEGIVIATCLAPLPAKHNHAAVLKPVLEFVDQYDETYPLEANVRVNRNVGEMNNVRRRTRHSSLFAPEESRVQGSSRQTLTEGAHLQVEESTSLESGILPKRL